MPTCYGRRDRTLLQIALQTGLRCSELIGLTVGDVALDPQAYVCCQGKGRKHRSTPLRGDTVKALREWLEERSAPRHQPLFTTNRGGPFSRDAFDRIVRKYALIAAETCPTLKNKRVSPHTLWHSAAMQLLRSGVGCTVIALWLGHESVEITQIYLHADMEIKKKAMDQTRPADVPEGAYRANDELLMFLEGL